MNHKAFRINIGFLIVALVVGGVLYLQWPRQPGEVQPVSRQTRPTTTPLFLESTPKPVLGPPLAEAAQISLRSAKLWIGLKNSDDQGTQFDLKAEVYKNSVLVASGQALCITGVTRNPDKAIENHVLRTSDTVWPLLI